MNAKRPSRKDGKKIKQGQDLTRRKEIYHDLDHLAGTWSVEDEKKFKKCTRSFEQIDECVF